MAGSGSSLQAACGSTPGGSITRCSPSAEVGGEVVMRLTLFLPAAQAVQPAWPRPPVGGCTDGDVTHRSFGKIFCYDRLRQQYLRQKHHCTVNLAEVHRRIRPEPPAGRGHAERVTDG